MALSNPPLGAGSGLRDTGFPKTWFQFAKDLVAIVIDYVICLLLVCGQTVWPKYVHDVAVPWGFAQPWWKVRLRGVV